mmetsp:Transcript_12756/g.23917  ORF Transcript_12756/g.23917 Transcript_12756/m.23917 type:complete len:922 (-) Transcript_12756:710-3475(-)
MESSLSFFDELRVIDSENFSPVFEDNHIGRNLHRYDGIRHSSIVLCHVPQFMSYTEVIEGRITDNSDLGYGASAATVMAIDHWNNGNGVIVDEVEGVNETCRIRFTTEVFDTQASPIPAVRGLTEMITRSPRSIAQPQPCAVLGTLYSTVSRKFATVTGVFDILQVAPSASSDVLDNEIAYPLFSRTHPSDSGAAKLPPKYLQEVLGVKHFAVVYISDDGYGISYLNVVLEYARANGMNVLSVPLTFFPTPSKDELKRELRVLLNSNLNYVVGVFFRNNYDVIMEAAYELGVAGPGKMWLFCGSLANFLYENAHEFKKGSAVANATFGNAIITDGGGAPGTPKYETFVEEWKKLGDDPDTLAYINSKQPISNGDLFDFNRTREWFHKAPNDVAIYSYEAIIGMGISACNAAAKSGSTFDDEDVFSGEEHHRAFRNIDFVSASGRVTIGPDNFSRNDLSTYYIVGNLLEVNSTKTTVSMQGKKHSFYDALNRRWNIYEGSGGKRQFIFSDGTTIAPPQLGRVEENMNLISGGVRSFCLLLSTIIIVLSICFLSCTVAMRKKTVFRMSQPPFLIMICIGTFLMATGIICLSMDEGVASITGLNVSCTLLPWLLSIGFVVTFAALFSKLWRINKLVKASRGFRRVTVTVFDVLVPFVILLSMNTIILIVWQSISPLRWEREVLTTNQYDQVIASEGSCNSKNSTVYISSLLFVNGIAIILACHQAYIGRNVRTEMNESKHIGMAMICIFQSCFFGIPLLFMTSSNRSAYLFISSSVYFVVCVSTLLCIFLPKFLKIQGIRLGTAENSRGPSVTGISSRARRLRSNVDVIDFDSLASPRDDQDTMMRERLKTLRSTQKEIKQKKQPISQMEEQCLKPLREKNEEHVEREGQGNDSETNLIGNAERSSEEIKDGQLVNDDEEDQRT